MLVMEDAHGQPFSLGSGFFVSEDIVATNFHVIEGAAKGYAKVVGQKAKYDIAGVVGLDRQHDLALLKLTGARAPSLPLGDSRQVAVGDDVYAIGNPRGLEGTFSQGIVSAIRQLRSDTLLQITAPVSPGSSGGPVLNSQGKAIGVAVATFKDGQNLNFAVPIHYLTALLSQRRVLAPIPARSAIRREKSILDQFRAEGGAGVVGGDFSWDSQEDIRGEYGLPTLKSPIMVYSFSLRNQLREDVRDLYGLVVFYDLKGQPLHAEEVQHAGVIPAGLARRIVNRSVHRSVYDLVVRSVPLYGPDGTFDRYASGRLEFRILDFRFVD
ncbi:MAG: S1C family serine protease [Candidatus Methylomirabilales bacterium]